MSACPRCNDSGEIGNYGIIDCTCKAAIQRHTLNVALASLPEMTKYDAVWYAFQAGIRAERERIKKLVDAEN